MAGPVWGQPGLFGDGRAGLRTVGLVWGYVTWFGTVGLVWGQLGWFEDSEAGLGMAGLVWGQWDWSGDS